MIRSDLGQLVVSHCRQDLAPFIGDDRVEDCENDLLRRWTERQRYHHTLEHLCDLLRRIDADWKAGSNDRAVLVATALFHDCVYHPGDPLNEEHSADVFRRWCGKKNHPLQRNVERMIEASNYRETPTGLLATFLRYDAAMLYEGDYSALSRLEKNIFREFQAAPYPEYRAHRLRFLREWHVRYPEMPALPKAIEVAEAFQPSIVAYAGSFNPFHLGHLDVIRRAEEAFDKVIVGVGVNRRKADQNLDSYEKLKTTLQFHQVDYFEGLVTQFLESALPGTTPRRLVRGLRDGYDLAKEIIQFRFIHDLDPQVEVMFFPCRRELAHVSSSAVRELSLIDPRQAASYCPDTKQIYGLVE